MSWQTPIYDRTNDDYEFAKAKIAEWIADPTLPRYDLKGCMNADDFNRIEGNIKYLSDKLNELYYHNSTNAFTQWDRESIPNVDSVERILNNMRVLVDKYYLQNGSPTVPDNIITLEAVNAIEEILQIIFTNIERMTNSFKKCGTIRCNNGLNLPLRR